MRTCTLTRRRIPASGSKATPMGQFTPTRLNKWEFRLHDANTVHGTFKYGIRVVEEHDGEGMSRLRPVHRQPLASKPRARGDQARSRREVRGLPFRRRGTRRRGSAARALAISGARNASSAGSRCRPVRSRVGFRGSIEECGVFAFVLHRRKAGANLERALSDRHRADLIGDVKHLEEHATSPLAGSPSDRHHREIEQTDRVTLAIAELTGERSACPRRAARPNRACPLRGRVVPTR